MNVYIEIRMGNFLGWATTVRSPYKNNNPSLLQTYLHMSESVREVEERDSIFSLKTIYFQTDDNYISKRKKESDIYAF